MKKRYGLFLILLFLTFVCFIITCCLYSEAISFNIDGKLAKEMFKDISVGFISAFL